MATEAVQSNGVHERSRARRPSLGRLWQVPTFFVGLALVATVWAARPLWRMPPTDRFQRDLAEFRTQVEKPGSNPTAVLKLGEALIRRADEFPEGAGPLHFLLGSYLLAQADTANDFLERALTNLEAARRLGVAANDRPRMLYRLGLARHRAGQEPARVIECLAKTVDKAADDRAQGYEILAEAYLQLPTPDVKAALEVNKKRLGLPTLNEELLTPARLLQGELLLRQGKPAEARETLARIGKDAPAKIRSRARFLQAQSCQEEQRWSEAALLWEEALAAGTPLPEKLGRVLCFLGICYRELGETEKAAQTWEKALAEGGEAGQAAAFALAEVHLLEDDAPRALEFYERALLDVPDAAGYRNSLVDLPEARRLLERGIDHFRASKAYGAADQLSRLYDKVAEKGVSQQRIADNADAWAKERQAADDPEGARKHYRTAGAAYEALARASRDPVAQADFLKIGSERFSQAGDHERALELARRRLEIETDAERTGEAWFALARVYLTRKEHNSAISAYRKCIEYPGVFAFRARYWLAAHDIDLGNFDDAESALKQNLELLRLKPDPETHELSLFTLAELLYRRGDYPRAAAKLQEALDHYPGNTQSFKARWHLAESYRQLADQETRQLSSPQLKPDVRLHHRDQYRKWLNMALANFQKLAYDLAALKPKKTFTPEEETMLRQADFAIGECQINLGQYPDAIKLYEILAARYHHQVEHLLALRQIWRCHWIVREPDKARNVVGQVRGVLNEMDETAFLGHPSKQTRKEWNDWIDWATKQ